MKPDVIQQELKDFKKQSLLFFERIEGKIDSIDTNVRKTNGRVTKLEAWNVAYKSGFVILFSGLAYIIVSLI